jgi:hypothetical protein
MIALQEHMQTLANSVLCYLLIITSSVSPDGLNDGSGVRFLTYFKLIKYTG